jgi:hypothetical protein
MKKHQQFFDEMTKFVGLFVLAVIVAGLCIGLAYGLLGYLSDNGRRLLATALIFAVPGAYLMGLQVAKSHRAGIERGLDLKLGGRERAQQAARPSLVQPTPTPAQRFDDLLPKVTSAAIVQRNDNDKSPIEL